MRLRELLHYDPMTGVFTRSEKSNRRVVIGAVASFNKNGRYARVCVNNQRYYAHRLAWLYMYGAWPEDGLQIDHIDGDKNNNKIANLRAATPSANSQNERKARPNSTSKLLGVHWSKNVSKWTAQIKIGPLHKCLGYFDDPVVAHNAYIAAKRIHHVGCTI